MNLIEILEKYNKPLEHNDFSIIHINKRVWIPHLEEKISKLWKKRVKHAKSRGVNLYPGALFNYLGTWYNKETQKPVLVVGDTNFKEYTSLITLSAHMYEDDRNKLLDNIAPLSFGAVIETKDNCLILGKRGEGIIAADEYMVPAGFINPKDMKSNGEIDVYATAHREIYEEIRVNNPSLRYLGIVRDLYTSFNPMMVFTGKVEHSNKKILEMYNESEDSWEHKKLIFVPNYSKDVLDFIIGKTTVDGMEKKVEKNYQIVGNGIGALLLHGSIHFGADWYNTAVTQLEKRSIIIKEK